MAIFEATSKLTSKNQTTIPGPVREALGVGEGDKLRFHVLEDGRVEVSKELDVADDAVVAAYLRFIERDIVENPHKLTPLVRDPETDRLVEGVDITGWLDEDQLS
jgi:antitoxin PrlF